MFIIGEIATSSSAQIVQASAEIIDVSRMVDLGVAAVIVVAVVAPLVRWLMKKIESDQSAFLAAIQENNKSHKEAIDKIAGVVQELSKRIDEQTDKVDTLAALVKKTDN